MILTGLEIIKEHAVGHLRIEPFDPAFVTTNTYDLTLGKHFCQYLTAILDPAIDNDYRVFEAPDDGVLMQAGDFLLGHSVENIGSDHYVPIIHARSTVARLGLFVHITADLIDIGSFGQVTFQLYATMPIRLRPGTRIGQVSFWVPKGEIVLYRGKYQNSRGPCPSKAFNDFRR
jgi:dCTP deaminase